MVGSGGGTRLGFGWAGGGGLGPLGCFWALYGLWSGVNSDFEQGLRIGSIRNDGSAETSSRRDTSSKGVQTVLSDQRRVVFDAQSLSQRYSDRKKMGWERQTLRGVSMHELAHFFLFLFVLLVWLLVLHVVLFLVLIRVPFPGHGALVVFR